MRFLLKHIRYLYSNSLVVTIVRFMHLSSLIKYIYHKLHTTKDRKKRLCFNGVEAHFYVKSFEELRAVETVFQRGNKDEENILAPLLQLLHPGDIAYDIGANMGIHTVFMAKKVGKGGRVIAMEPESNSYETLSQNVRLNDLSNVTSIQVALGEKIDTGTLFMRSRIGIGAASLIESDGSDFCQAVEIIPGDLLVHI